MAFRDVIDGVWLLLLVVSELHFRSGVIAVPSLQVPSIQGAPQVVNGLPKDGFRSYSQFRWKPLIFHRLCFAKICPFAPFSAPPWPSKHAIQNHFKTRLHDVQAIAKQFGNPVHDVQALSKQFKTRWNDVQTPSEHFKKRWKLVHTPSKQFQNPLHVLQEVSEQFKNPSHEVQASGDDFKTRSHLVQTSSKLFAEGLHLVQSVPKMFYAGLHEQICCKFPSGIDRTP
jgi:hypothetical protein